MQRFGVLANGSGPNGRRGPEVVRAATLAEAAAAAGVDFGVHVTAALNGDQITRDGQTPLAAGDTVSFRRAAGNTATRAPRARGGGPGPRASAVVIYVSVGWPGRERR